MATFDFISGDDFRASLESDYQELVSALGAKSWKSVHVLAGSIIEAVLADYLVALGYPKSRSKDPLESKDPLTMSLFELVSACKKEGVLTERASDLSTVVRGYRNLIHPGRLIRLKEREAVDEDSAKVAHALVEMIVKEVAATRGRKFGYTAEQILTKLEQDASVVTILAHLAKDIPDKEMERLLVKVLPGRYLQYMLTDEPADPALNNLSTCFHQLYALAPKGVQASVARRYVTILKEESQNTIFTWERDLFRGEFLSDLSADDASLVKQHLMSRLNSDNRLTMDNVLGMIDGLGPFLEVPDAAPLTVAIIRASLKLDGRQRTRAYATVLEVYASMKPKVQERFVKRLEYRWTQLENVGRSEDATAVRALTDLLATSGLDESL